MADNVTVDNGALTDYVVSSEELSGGEQLQSVELHTEAAGTKTKLAKLEDAAHSSGDAGIQMLSVRKDTAAATSGTDGDYQPLVTGAAGRLWTSATIDAALPAGTNAIGKLAANDGVDVGDVTINNASGASAVNIQDGGNSITVDGTVAVSNATFPVTDNGGSLTVDNGGTFAVQATVAAAATNIAKAEDAASADADVGVPAMAVRKGTPANTSGTDGDYEMLQMSAGRVWASATIDAALPAGTNAIGKLAANSGVDIGDVDVTSVTPGTTATALGKAEDAAHTSGDVGVMALAVRDTAPAANSGTDGDYETLHVSDEGGLWTAEVASSQGGCDAFFTYDADETEEDVKTSAGSVYGWYFYNDGAAEVYVRLYNATAANTTVGSTAAKLVLPVPAGSAANMAFSPGIKFDTAICVAATTGSGAADTGAPAASQVTATIFYK